MFKQRLLKLADLLDTVPRKRFNISSWASSKFCGKPKEPEHNECNTTACAMGWATTLPVFKRAGLKLRLPENKLNYDGCMILTMAKKHMCSTYLTHMDAAAAVCGISYHEAQQLFDVEDPSTGKPRSRETPKQVARRIRKFVKSCGEVPE